jgi:hypothetical protein
MKKKRESCTLIRESCNVFPLHFMDLEKEEDLCLLPEV